MLAAMLTALSSAAARAAPGNPAVLQAHAALAQLLDSAYDDTLDVQERAIDSHIKNLRKKLKAAGGGEHDGIRSVYGVGFALDLPAG